MIVAVVPAAGQSARMGQPKLSLHLGDRTVLEHVVSELQKGGVDQVLVVTAPHIADLPALAHAAGADVYALAGPTFEMRTTVEAGLHWFAERHGPRPPDAFILAPGDHPAFSAEVVRSLCEAYRDDPSRSIVVPVYDGKRGHPVLISWQHVRGINELPAQLGINSYLRAHTAVTWELPVSEAGVLLNMNTQESYRVLRNMLAARLPATPPGVTALDQQENRNEGAGDHDPPAYWEANSNSD